MRFSTIIPLALAAAGSVSALPLGRSDSGDVLSPVLRTKNNNNGAIVAQHARRSGLAHGSPLRKVRRKKVKRAGVCRPRSTTSSSPAATLSPTASFEETWARPSHSTSDDRPSSSWSHGGWDNEVDGSPHYSYTEWSSSVASTSTSDHSSSSALPSPSPSSSSGWENEVSAISDQPTINPSGAESSSSLSSSSASISPSGISQPTGGSTVSESALFPLGRGTASWTCGGDSGALSFDEAILPLQFGRTPTIAAAPDGATAYQQIYPGGEYGKGFSFYFQGDKNGVNIMTAREVMLSYSVYFKEDFAWTMGGKLPGLYGGTSLESAKSCSGGRSDGRDDCFSARLMWRAGGAGELYNYFPPAAENQYCNVPPKSVCNKQYGDSIARGAFTWKAGTWNTVSQRVKLNDLGVKNGEQELFVNGQSIINLKNVEIAMHAETKFYGVMAQTFFGGSGDQYAPSGDQTAWFKDWTLILLS